MALDGIMFEGVSVRVRRPNDYNPAAAAALGPAVPNPALNLLAIGLHPGGMNAVSSPALLLSALAYCMIAPASCLKIIIARVLTRSCQGLSHAYNLV